MRSILWWDCFCFWSLQWLSNQEFDSTRFSFLLNSLPRCALTPFVTASTRCGCALAPFIAFVTASTSRRTAFWPPLLLNLSPCRAALWPPLSLQHDGWHRWWFVPSLFSLCPLCPLSLGAWLISSHTLSSCCGRCEPLPQQQPHRGSSCWSGV